MSNVVDMKGRPYKNPTSHEEVIDILNYASSMLSNAMDYLDDMEDHSYDYIDDAQKCIEDAMADIINKYDTILR